LYFLLKVNAIITNIFKKGSIIPGTTGNDA